MQIGRLCFTILAGGLAKLVNRAARLQGVQLGRVNLSSQGGLPFLPLVNVEL
ncbi:hypothetical protein [Polyangium sp. 6x1]|uniref:hypothetical protein n=1 Tax=Polyangium sp. 6x1 TaxID=3042689 RepID=UPI00248310E6|nr:hypothetical protein [Polyangium sp. 6x1]MDI1443468.1 hypothetical protein [Polyangium sp. 6x1]